MTLVSDSLMSRSLERDDSRFESTPPNRAKRYHHADVPAYLDSTPCVTPCTPGSSSRRPIMSARPYRTPAVLSTSSQRPFSSMPQTIKAVSEPPIPPAEPHKCAHIGNGLSETEQRFAFDAVQVKSQTRKNKLL